MANCSMSLKPPKRLAIATSLAALVVSASLALWSQDQANAAGRAEFKPKGGVWRGSTSQGFPVRFRVQERIVSRAVFTVDTGPCEISYPRGMRDSDRIIFRSFSLFGAGSDFFVGRFLNRSQARGSAQASNFDVGCGGRTVRWTAHAP
jgi:hypothetical protein